MDSILISIKKMLGIIDEYKFFDSDLIIHINSAFMILNQLGVGPSEGFTISDEYATWNNFIPEDDKNFELVKSYVQLKVKLLFDPPMSSVVMECINKMINEFEWRLNVASESQQSSGEEENQNG